MAQALHSFALKVQQWYGLSPQHPGEHEISEGVEALFEGFGLQWNPTSGISAEELIRLRVPVLLGIQENLRLFIPGKRNGQWDLFKATGDIIERIFISKEEVQTLIEASPDVELGIVRPLPQILPPSNDHPSPLKRGAYLLKAEGKQIQYLYIYALLIGLIGLTLPLGVQAIIGLVAGGLFTQSIWLLIALVVIGVGASGGLQIVQQYIVEVMQQRLFVNAAQQFATRIPRWKADKASKIFGPEMLNRFFDVLTLQKGITKILIDLPTSVLNFFLGLGLLSFYHPYFIFFGAIMMGVLAIILRLTSPTGLRTSIEESGYKYRTAHFLQMLAAHPKTVDFPYAFQWVMEKTDRLLNGYVFARRRHFAVLARQQAWLVGFKVVVTAGLLIMGCLLVIDRQINLGQFVASELVILLVIQAVEKIIRAMETVYDVLTAIDKLGYVTDVPIDHPQRLQKAGTSEMELRGVHIPGSGAFSTTIPRGEIRQFVLPPGHQALPALASQIGMGSPILSGKLSLDGMPVYSADLPSAIAHNMDEWAIYPATLRENLALGALLTDEQMAKALKETGLGQWLADQPDGLNTILLSEGHTLPRHVREHLLITRMALRRAPANIIWVRASLSPDDWALTLQALKGFTVLLLTAREIAGITRVEGFPLTPQKN